MKELKSSLLSYENTNVLVLDDEISIAEFIALFLESKGTNVVVANNKEQLLEKSMATSSLIFSSLI